MYAHTIVIAEDEPVIAFDLRQLFEAYHFQVLEADNPASIEALCRKYQPDLVIINFKQSKVLDGLGLAAMLRKHFSLPVLCITGARAQDIRQSRHFDAAMPVLHKPFTHHQLLRVVQQSMGAAA
jgi:DNA-binding response OmpR family regulator